MKITTVFSEHVNEFKVGLRPLPPGKAVWYFLLAGLILRGTTYYLLPTLLGEGLLPFEAFVVTFMVPMAVLFALALGTVKHEGIPMTPQAIMARLRLRPLTWRHLGWIIVGFIVATIGAVALAPTRGWLMTSLPVLQPPESFPIILQPGVQNAELPATMATWMGVEAVGNWGYAMLALLLFFFNQFGEELYWRGVLLPRQELVHGRKTWLVHGLMWNLFHLPIYPWYLLYGLPLTLAISFVAQKTGNTWTGILLHALANLTMLLLMLGVVAGMIQ